MSTTHEYNEFLNVHGRKLSEINPGSSEFALTVADAMRALEILKKNHIVILGGDILSQDENGRLGYIIHLWGAKYQYLNWYCNRDDNESETEYSKRSCEVANTAIAAANEMAKELMKECFVVLVT